MLELLSVSKVYDSPAGEVPVLRDISLRVRPGEAVSILGPSGSGKTTLLHILGLLARPTAGELVFDGHHPLRLDENKQARFRNDRIGFVFQDPCLLPQCTVLENVIVPTLIAPQTNKEEELARLLVERLGLAAKVNEFPASLSAAEQQRASIARAFIRQPQLLLCDEPTGNLDEAAGSGVVDALLGLQREAESILVLVTHDAKLAARFPLRYALRGRRLEPIH